MAIEQVISYRYKLVIPGWIVNLVPAQQKQRGAPRIKPNNARRYLSSTVPVNPSCCRGESFRSICMGARQRRTAVFKKGQLCANLFLFRFREIVPQTLKPIGELDLSGRVINERNSLSRGILRSHVLMALGPVRNDSLKTDSGLANPASLSVALEGDR
jgi:hypothetical protein